MAQWCIRLFIICMFGICCAWKNVLFLVSDDMRPELGAYSGPDFPSPVHPRIHSPNLDALAARSLLLKRAYVQQAVCSPSRTSLLTGRRPDTTHVYDLVKYFRDVGGNFTTIPEYFKLRGYRSIGMGKIFHPGQASGHDDPISWSEPYFHGISNWEGRSHSWLAVPDASLKKKPLIDEQIAQHAIETLRRVAPAAISGEQPFFVAVGFHKPHLPFVFPKHMLQYYPLEDIRLPDNQYAPVKMPDVAWANYMNIELAAYKDIAKLNASGDINTTLPADIVLHLRRAYYSALSWTDSLIGKVIAELDTLGLANETIISFWGDHGWQLGEHGEWCKHTNFEVATHAPMIIRVPGLTDHGVVTERLSEFVDLFPTLADAAGLDPLPLCPKDSSNIALCREGTSLMPLIKNPARPWKDAVFSQYPREVNGIPVMGYTLTTGTYRYTEWVKFSGKPSYTPDWSTLFGVELYNHTESAEENYNRAYDDSYSAIRRRLSKLLHDGWRTVLPPGSS